MDELGVADLDELAACFDTPLSEAEWRFLETRDRILARRNPELLAEEELWTKRVVDVVEAVCAGN